MNNSGAGASGEKSSSWQNTFFLSSHPPRLSWSESVTDVKEQKTIKEWPNCQLEFGVRKDPDCPELFSPLSASRGLLGQSSADLWTKHSQDVQAWRPATENLAVGGAGLRAPSSLKSLRLSLSRALEAH